MIIRLNPKLSFYYNQNENLEFYLSLGKGFHSNDARSVVAGKGDLSLPAAHGADLGTVFKPCRKSDHPCRAMVYNAGPGKCL